jgi:glycosyltransferase involved in cell wall biosynthesis
MNILFFTYDLPYPLVTGGKIRAYHLLKTLAKKHKVTLVSFYRTDSQLEYIKNLSFLENVHTFKRRNLYSAGTLPHLWNYPFPAALYYDSQVKLKIQELIRSSQFDVVHYESFYTTVFMDTEVSIPQIVGTENIEWHIYKQYLEQQPIVIQPFLQHEINRIKKFEERTWKNANSCIAVSEENKEIIESVIGKKCEIIPNGVDLDVFTFNKSAFNKDELRFLFVGSLQYIQNKDAAQWLTAAIWPKIKEVLSKHNKKGTLSIVGPGTDQLSIGDETIECIGEVDDIVDAYNKHDILLAPLRAGSGTKFKVLESASVGNLVITTDVGSEGLDGFKNYEELLVANTPEEFAQSVEFLILHPDKAKVIAENARDAVHKYHSWETVGKKLLKYYETVVDNHR